MRRMILASDWEEPQEEWLIPGLVCDSLTLISGEPKAGKSALASHLVRSLITGRPVLDKTPTTRFGRVGWMGFDFKWQREVRERMSDLQKQIMLVPSIHYQDKESWERIYLDFRPSGIDFLVIDHLYGLGLGAELDKQFQAQQVLAPLNEIVHRTGIPVLLLTQGAKMRTGRAAHSVAMEGNARWLLRISGSGKKSRTIETLGNNYEAETYKVRLTPYELTQIENQRSSKANPKNVENSLPKRANFLIKNAPEEAKASPTTLGSWYAAQGLGINTSGSGRSLVNNLIQAGLLARDNKNGPIGPGPKLITRSSEV